MLAFVTTQPLTVAVLLVVVLALTAVVLGIRLIGEHESGLVIKRYGRPLPPGRLIATRGEAGYQAALLSPGWHFPLWRWQYKVERVPLVTVPAGQIACVVAADGQPIPPERVLGKAVACDQFQDASAFLDGGGERGRQLAILGAGTYRINPIAFEVITAATAPQHGLAPRELQVFQVAADTVGIVTVLDGRPITSGDMAGPVIAGHDGFQRAHAFIAAGGCRGLQEEVLLSGAWNLNPWFVRVELVPLTEIPIGYVGVVVSYVGQEHLDVTGADFTHGDLVERGRKGVWVEPLLPGKHPLNIRVMKVELVPTTNIVLNWAGRTEAHHYDDRLAPITVRSKDGFSFSLDVSAIIHIGMKDAPRVISRVGSMQNLVDHVLQPVVGNYFRNSAQQVTVLEFLSARTERQREAFTHISAALAEYDVECIDALVGDIQAPAELMKTQTDRKIADELQRTYDAQREAEVKRQALARESAVANMQAEVVRSEQMVRIAETNASSAIAAARGEAGAAIARAEADAQAVRLRAEADGAATEVNGRAQAVVVAARGDAEASAQRAIGAARADAFEVGKAALGDAFASIEIATVLANAGVKLVPDVAVGGGDGATRLADVLVARMLVGPKASA
ncbi:MAG TPA: SPFH domain-containing protein [Kofleriaceae bacterium]|nr:SPFH domain-containing protein [Kofleriaceae bacterium]